jgi:DNA (cytosine-5)-methyltransferase 1
MQSPRYANYQNMINTLSLLAGGGGLDLGFSAAGFNSILSSDIDPYSCETLALNQGKQRYLSKHPVLCEDVNNIFHKTIRKQIGSNDVYIIIGVPTST